MIKEFKEFISKGNVMDMAVGIIIGGAFTAIVNALVANILMPLIGLIAGGSAVSDLSFSIKDTVFNYGALLQAIIDFVLIAFVLFLIIKAMNKMRKKKEEGPATTKKCPYCITDIAIEATRCPNCTSELPAKAE
ncbi:MAG: large conductance mechanosensitive channel protein MscL [Lachnospiraceae bacterium]|nr:large conductance mechanosensitive channel protein MscL [Lachnospiraceae bacterium]